MSLMDSKLSTESAANNICICNREGGEPIDISDGEVKRRVKRSENKLRNT
jgi:hypothetical protein